MTTVDRTRLAMPDPPPARAVAPSPAPSAPSRPAKPLLPVARGVVRSAVRWTEADAVQLFLWLDGAERPLHVKEGRCPAVVPAKLMQAAREAARDGQDQVLADGTAVLPLRPGARAVAALALRNGGPLDDEARADLSRSLDDAIERLWLSEAARHQESRFRDFARASGDWLWETDAHHVCEWVSDNFEAQTGYPAERVLGHMALNSPLLDSLGQPLEHGTRLMQVMDRHEDVRAVCTMGHGERQRMIAVSAVPKYDEEGRFVGFRGVSRDVTDRIHLEMASRERDAAERANRSKSEFLSRVSHELRTPLNAILGLSQLLLERRHGCGDAQELFWLQSIHRSGQYLLAMVNELLDLGRIEQGQLNLAIQDFIVEEALALAQTVARGDAAPPGVTLQMHLGDARTPVRGDPVAVEQILVNLMSNAFKYNRQGGRIDVSVEAQGPFVRVYVADTGIGIPAERQSSLFMPFQRLGAEHSRIPGSGLGLSIAHALAEKMGGSLEIESAPGVGTMCTLTLPRGEAAPAEEEALATRRSCFDSLPEREVELLYIEDDPINQILLQEVVRALPGWTLRVADDAAAGLRLLAQHRPDIVLLDMNLPDASGLQVLQAVRADASTRDRVCVALSADAMPEQVQAALGAGFDDYWTKPFSVRDLRRRLLAVASRTPSTA